MYSTAKKLSIFIFIIAIMNIVFTALRMLELARMDFAQAFIQGCYYVTGTASSILLCVAIRSICSDLEIDYETKIRQIREQNKKIAELEDKIEKLQKNA